MKKGRNRRTRKAHGPPTGDRVAPARERAERVASMLDRWAAEDVATEPDWDAEHVPPLSLRGPGSLAFRRIAAGLPSYSTPLPNDELHPAWAAEIERRARRALADPDGGDQWADVEKRLESKLR